MITNLCPPLTRRNKHPKVVNFIRSIWQFNLVPPIPPFFNSKSHISPPSFQAACPKITNYEALRRPLYSWSAAHQSGHVCSVFILLIICDDLPVLVGVQSVEEIVTAVLPWRVRELEDRQEWKIKRCVYTARGRQTESLLMHTIIFPLQFADSESVYVKKNYLLQMYGCRNPFRVMTGQTIHFKTSFKKNSLK